MTQQFINNKDFSLHTCINNHLPKICFMTYYKLRELAEPTILDLSKRANIKCIDASFDEALSIAKHLIETNKVDAFVSAGSNASILKEHLQLPIISIEVSGYDLLRSFMEAKQYGRNVGIISFKNTLPSLKEFTSLLNLNIHEMTYTSPHEAILCIDKLEKQNVDVIIGSSLIFDLSQKRNFNAVLTYSPNSIHNAFNQAIEVCRIKKLESNRFDQIKSILQTLPEAVVAVDHNERVTAINKKMEAIISPNKTNIYGKSLSNIDEVLSLCKVLNTKEKIGTPLHHKFMKMAKLLGQHLLYMILNPS